MFRGSPRHHDLIGCDIQSARDSLPVPCNDDFLHRTIFPVAIRGHKARAESDDHEVQLSGLRIDPKRVAILIIIPELSALKARVSRP